MDKMVNMDIQAWKYRNIRNRIFHPHDLTFEYFIKDLGIAPLSAFDIHWRPQIDFLVYEKYDDFFCLENFAAAVSTLKEKIDLEIYDTRSFLNHHISRIEPDSSIELPFKQSAIDLLVLKRAGRIPVVSKMYNEELTDIVKNRYHEDIELYLSKFQPSKIMDEVL